MNKEKSKGVDSQERTATVEVSFGKQVKDFLAKTLNAMTFGIFATIVVGTILQQVGLLLKIDVLAGLVNVRLGVLLGVGIGMSVALALKLEGLKFIVIAIAGGVATSFRVDFTQIGWFVPDAVNNNPITSYFVVVLTYLAVEAIFKKKTPYDLFFIPIIGILTAVFATYLIGWPIDRFMDAIYWSIEISMQAEPYTTTAVVSLIFGVLLTLPFVSSAGIAIAVFAVPFANNNPIAIIAMCAAVVGCSVQMVGFAYQSRKNDIGTIFSIGIASSMFQFKNIIKKPIIWLPTLIASLVLGPINYLLFDGFSFFIDSVEVGHSWAAAWPGMGTSGLVGQLQTLAIADYQLQAWLFVASQIFLSLGLVALLDWLFIRFNGYQADDLILSSRL